MLSDEAFWAALEEHLARSGKPAEVRSTPVGLSLAGCLPFALCQHGFVILIVTMQTRKLVATVKARHDRNIQSLSLDQMDRMAASILAL